MDNGRVSYEEAVEAIRNWNKAVYDFSDDDVETIYANGRPIDMVRKQTRNALTIYDLEYGYRVPVGNFTSMQETEGMVRCITPSRERSLALTKLDEALFWANAAIAAEGVMDHEE